MEEVHTSQTEPAPSSEDGEGALWARFVEAPTVAAFCQCWLAIQCRQLAGVRGAAVLVRSGEGESYAPIAVWPDVRQPMEHLSAVAERALGERRGVLERQSATAQGGRSGRFHLAYPVEVDDALIGVAALEVDERPEPELKHTLRQLHWGIAWLIDLFRRQRTESDREALTRMTAVLDLVALAVEKPDYRAASTAVVTELAARFNCERVSMGFVKGRYAVVDALSNSAHFKKESNLLRNIGQCMDEAVEQQATIVYPEPDDTTRTAVIRAARDLAERHESAAVACVPFNVDGDWCGAICLERATLDNRFTTDDAYLLQAAASLLGPVLHAKRQNDRSLMAKMLESGGKLVGRFTGEGHVAWKLGGIAAIAAVVFAVFATGEYRVTADAALEGGVQTAIVAPFGGYVAEAFARPGDVVDGDELMAVLDDRDLRLERLRWASQRDEISRQLREARAERDLAQIRILEAQLGQAEAQLELVSGQLERTRLTAPYPGVVISGDLSQSLGAPVERGEVLFEVAPLDAYRLVLEVDDRDIIAIEPGETGTLTLAALPQDRFEFEVTRVTPVASAAEGRNFFRVEARLSNESARLRPGMNGVGKINLGERRLVWIWTHRLIDWWRLWSWSFMP